MYCSKLNRDTPLLPASAICALRKTIGKTSLCCIKINTGFHRDGHIQTIVKDNSQFHWDLMWIIPFYLRIDKGFPSGALHFSRCIQNYESCITT